MFPANRTQIHAFADDRPAVPSTVPSMNFAYKRISRASARQLIAFAGAIEIINEFSDAYILFTSLSLVLGAAGQVARCHSVRSKVPKSPFE
jgi:hypothetical protein